jgi:hypothetical protein
MERKTGFLFFFLTCRSSPFLLLFFGSDATPVVARHPRFKLKPLTSDVRIFQNDSRASRLVSQKKFSPVETKKKTMK